MLNLRRPWNLLLLSLPLTALACLSPGNPPQMRFYSVNLPQSAPGSATSRALWVRNVHGAGHLGKRFAYQKSDVEFGYRELVRWTEEPSTYVRRALEDELFANHFQRSESSGAYRLEVDLRAFEEQFEPQHSARVAFVVRLEGLEGVGLLEQKFEHTTPIEGADSAATARAMGLALSVATRAASQAIDRAAR